jgi:Vitamin K-dependent gamma-carboxylase
MRERWSRFWFAPSSRRQLAVTRILVAAVALWIVLSRNDLPSILLFPRTFWNDVLPERRVRFFLLFDIGTERLLWTMLHVTLITTLAGIATRWSALISGLLLYHFGALEAVLWTGNPYLRGYTIPSLALLIIAASASGGSFARRREADEPSWENRWPVALIQVLFAQIYFFSAWAKVATSGLAWFEPSNLRRYILGLDQFLGIAHAPLNLFIASHPVLCSAMAGCGMALDASFPLVLVSDRMRRIILAAAVFFHIAIGIVFHIWFQNAWLLLIFVKWDGRGKMTAECPT